MADITFEPRYAIDRMLNPDPSWLRNVILNPHHAGREFGEATLVLRQQSLASRLIFITDRTHGYYFKFVADAVQNDIWLSLGDATKLGEVICPDDWEVSVGLFVPIETAWTVIEQFCRTAQRSSAIVWISPSEMPENGNW